MFDFNLDLHKKVRIIIKSRKYHEIQGKIWFGFPVGTQIFDTRCENLDTILNSTTGYFCFIYFDSDKVIIANDILGGFRLYTYECNDILIITDDYHTILSEIRKRANLIEGEIDEVQLQYWKKHGYTFGDRTFIKGLNKVLPGSIITIEKKTISNDFYFKRGVIRENSVVKHRREVRNAITASFRNLKIQTANKFKVILLFSGGRDSTYLAREMLRLGIDFDPIFFYSDPPYEANVKDFLRANIVAKQIGIQLRKIDISWNENKDVLPILTKDLLFDRHFALLHYLGFSQLRGEYDPENTIVINGQGSDSIFSFGPSEDTIGDFLRRLTIYFPTFSHYFLGKIFERKFQRKFIRRSTKNDNLVAFANSKNYVFLKESISDAGLDGEMLNYIKDLNIGSYSDEETRMRIKIGLFLQGSDNQVAICAPRAFGFNKVFLPFSNPVIINATIKYKSILKEILSPKYVIPRAISGTNVLVEKEMQKKFISLDELEKAVYNYYLDEINKIKSTEI